MFLDMAGAMTVKSLPFSILSFLGLGCCCYDAILLLTTTIGGSYVTIPTILEQRRGRLSAVIGCGIGEILVWFE